MMPAATGEPIGTSLNNHLIMSMEWGGAVREFDVQFRFGETREYVYRLGDEVYVKADDSRRSGVVAGIAPVFESNEGQLKVVAELWFRILVIDRVIVSFALTSEEDYEALDRESLQGG